MKVKNLPKEAEDLFVLELKRRDYGKATIEVYKRQLNAFAAFVNPKQIDSASFKDITNYLDHLRDRKRLAPQTRNQIYWSLKFYFNDLRNRNFPFDTYKVPRRFIRVAPKVISEEEVLKIIASTETFRDRLVISLAYSTAIELGELAKLKVEDVDFKNKLVRIPANRGKVRYALLADVLIEDLKEYLKEEKPKRFLFEGRTKGTPLAPRSIQTVFGAALKKCGLVSKYTFKNLKYSYVKHLEKRGHNIVSILETLGNNSSATVYQYLLMDREEDTIKASPLDLISQNGKQLINTEKLKNRIAILVNDDEKDYLYEAIDCFNSGALRAGVILSWIAAIRNIQYKLLTHSLHSLNAAIQRHVKDAKNIRSVEDFSYIKESIQLRVACDVGEIDKNQKGILEDCLDLRNHCGHPGKYKPEEHKVLSFLEDLLTIVFK